MMRCVICKKSNMLIKYQRDLEVSNDSQTKSAVDSKQIILASNQSLIPNSITTQSTAIVPSLVPNKSPLKELIKIGIRKLRETGILAYVWKTWISHIPLCARSDVDVVPVDMIHFSTALYVLGFGIQISIALFVVELLVTHYLKS